MNIIAPLFIPLHRLLVRLYPRPFREAFGAEMETVFQEQVAEAAAQGDVYLLRVCWLELRDWPLHCLRAHWQVRQQRLQEQLVSPPSWWATAASGLPYLLLALLVSGSTLYFIFGNFTGLLYNLLVGYGLVIILLLVLIVAWWRGWPIWSVTWLSFLFYTLLVLFVPGQLAGFIFAGSQSLLLQIVVGELGFSLLWLAVLYLLLARWPRSGLAAMLPTFGITWLLYLEFVPESAKAAVMAISWIWLGIVAVLMLRRPNRDGDVWLLYLAGVVVGAIYVYAGHFLTEPPVRDGTLGRMADDLISDLLPALIPLAGILLLHTLRMWSRRHHRPAETGYRLLLAGILCALIGVQLIIRLMLRQESGEMRTVTWLAAAALIGYLLMAVGGRLILGKHSGGPLAVGWSLPLLLGLLLLLPLLFDVRWTPAAYRRFVALRSGPGPLVQEETEKIVILLRQIGYAAGVVWLLLAAWTSGRVRRQLPPLPAPTDGETVSSATPATPVRTGVSRREKSYFIAGLILLVVLLLRPTRLAILFPNDQVQPFDSPTGLALFLVVTAALILVARLLSAAIRLYVSGTRGPAVRFFIPGFLLLGAALYYFYQLTVWDNTTDALGYIWLFIPVTGLCFAALWLAVTVPHRARLAAFFYLLLMPLLLFLISRQAQTVDFYRVTDLRAERVSQALQEYHAQVGTYPDALRRLSPRYLISLSEPLIIFGQDWCYDSDGREYQFGYVYREHWSNPELLGHTYAASAGGSNLPAICADEISELQARDPGYYGRQNAQ